MNGLVRVCEKSWNEEDGDASGQWRRRMMMLRAEVVREKTAC